MYVIACLFFLRNAQNFWQVLIGLCVVGFAYGGYLALMPSCTADYFGAKNIGANYGIMFTAWGVCGFTVPKYFAGIMVKAKSGRQSCWRLQPGLLHPRHDGYRRHRSGACRQKTDAGDGRRRVGNNRYTFQSAIKKGGSIRGRPFSIFYRLISYLPAAALLAALSGFTLALATTGASFST